jgi:predicted lipoprotein with Yx(FWY)xxD motif
MISRRMITVTALVALLAVVVMASGCAQIAEQAAKSAVESATGIKVDTSGDSVTVAGSDGSAVSTTKGKLPEGFPEGMPVYEPGTITTGIATESGKGKGFMVGIDTEDSAADVFTWYETELADKDWVVKTTMKTEDGGLLSGEKGTTIFTIAVTTGSGSARTNVAITLAPK